MKSTHLPDKANANTMRCTYVQTNEGCYHERGGHYHQRLFFVLDRELKVLEELPELLRTAAARGTWHK